MLRGTATGGERLHEGASGEGLTARSCPRVPARPCLERLNLTVRPELERRYCGSRTFAVLNVQRLTRVHELANRELSPRNSPLAIAVLRPYPV